MPRHPPRTPAPVRLKVGRLIVLVTVALFAARGANADSPGPPLLRAAFLYTFAIFTEWPAEDAGDPMTLCVVDESAVAAALTQIVAGRSVAGRAITVRVATAGNLRTCHVLYLPGATVARALEEVSGARVLTIGDGAAFVGQGGMAGLYLEGERMRFAVNPDSAARAGVRLSSKLLGLARIVKDEHRVQP